MREPRAARAACAHRPISSCGMSLATRYSGGVVCGEHTAAQPHIALVQRLPHGHIFQDAAPKLARHVDGSARWGSWEQCRSLMFRFVCGPCANRSIRYVHAVGGIKDGLQFAGIIEFSRHTE